MNLWRQSDQYTQEESLNRLFNRAVLSVLVFGIIGCAVALFFSVRDQNWGGSATISAVLVILILAVRLTYSGKSLSAFRLMAVFVFLIVTFRVTVFQGVDNLAFFIIFPLIVMIGVLYRDRPTYIAVLGGMLAIWLLSLYLLEGNDFYEDQLLEISIQFKFVVISISILILIVVLQLTTRNILVANQRLVAAKEDAIKAQTAAEEANQAKSTFLANMSHELRTPLNAIIGYSELIQEISEEDVSEDSKKIELSAKNLLGIINSILEISKIESRTFRVDRSTFDVQDLVNEVTIIVAPQIEAKGNRYSVESRISNGSIFADRQKLLQILINLIGNANKFTDSGNIALKISNDDQEMTFSVEDDGIGISEEAQLRIFEPFEQVNHALNRNYDGVGLGLAICKQFAVIMNGRLKVKSKLGCGSTFTLMLPILAPTSADMINHSVL
ncbi:MAG: ATP-binding protein [Chloroflexota bacterium]